MRWNTYELVTIMSFFVENFDTVFLRALLMHVAYVALCWLCWRCRHRKTTFWNRWSLLMTVLIDIATCWCMLIGVDSVDMVSKNSNKLYIYCRHRKTIFWNRWRLLMTGLIDVATCWCYVDWCWQCWHGFKNWYCFSESSVDACCFCCLVLTVLML